MLSLDDNEFVTRVGPGTPMGSLMREYWVPAALSSELPHPDCDPVRVMLLGEKLIAFRDSAGKVGLVQNLCPHRGTSLFFGRNEDGGIRCVYHGWKFDTAGNCTDMPNEPPESNFKTRVKATAYPCVERGGIIWTYMGSREVPPPLPLHEALDLPEGAYDVGAGMRNCNWLQGLEGDLDTSHLYFLHFGSKTLEETEPGSADYYQVKDRAPRYMSVDTDFGSMYGAYRPAGPGENYWRMANFLFPFYAHIPGDHGVSHRMWVPMHDHHTMFYVLHKPDTDAQRIIGKRLIQWNVPLEPQNTTDWYGRFRLEQDASNDYLIDRDAQRNDVIYTGITHIAMQDQAITESMGDIVDHSFEHLAPSDQMITRTRRRLLMAARSLHEKGVAPPCVDQPDIFKQVRSGEAVLAVDDWQAAYRDRLKHALRPTGWREAAE
jgi:phenylpropionate dioxygenase-like ring-hydroxylating dioxygenase large terminal subunit